ncbi:MAG: hypothetical protein K6T90_20720 [Leptolyngbyaceae cyanobacterium HOT.MB2.61]|nr:hypothetical protein [Leptolyngbyaceae cyanobacterium HOT.MB2.61]
MVNILGRILNPLAFILRNKSQQRFSLWLIRFFSGLSGTGSAIAAVILPSPQPISRIYSSLCNQIRDNGSLASAS